MERTNLSMVRNGSTRIRAWNLSMVSESINYIAYEEFTQCGISAVEQLLRCHIRFQLDRDVSYMLHGGNCHG